MNPSNHYHAYFHNCFWFCKMFHYQFLQKYSHYKFCHYFKKGINNNNYNFLFFFSTRKTHFHHSHLKNRRKNNFHFQNRRKNHFPKNYFHLKNHFHLKNQRKNYLHLIPNRR